MFTSERSLIDRENGIKWFGSSLQFSQDRFWQSDDSQKDKAFDLKALQAKKLSFVWSTHPPRLQIVPSRVRRKEAMQACSGGVTIAELCHSVACWWACRSLAVNGPPMAPLIIPWPLVSLSLHTHKESPLAQSHISKQENVVSLCGFVQWTQEVRAHLYIYTHNHPTL